ncbi:cytochrome c oxidase subunit IV [Capnocytophaga canimorsus]|nr:cytochrome c oxidase subunit IV [Capnocytophaga canimorsus]ATA77100.1 CcoQ/FixQ family Cbb3-type cytochrome c oxidase assembly chaperone [Capnocytophaga canimorsus]ATA91686.1 CcoQ/FixQ family Cbb3-type cytochrome c oxidase assembly chaperone [Capnocytophaga canimorsus]ATA93856.1 CcoQ/FixQ family Cbb3-type cytochrome c oxidase assembly chaperone [Capnocytophaga canimorsus]AWL78563.1 CcoQ/FixQ family Cbb3-type cytochrome c oxidase assembly chaperone [Capnocytophaga canimorsus]AYW37175.1 CcoQ/
MLKFVKDHMASIDGIEIFPIISLLIFFLFFVGLFWWVIGYKKETIKELDSIPFDNDNENNDTLS